MKPRLIEEDDKTAAMVCQLAGSHVSNLLATHYRDIRDKAIAQGEATGKAPKVGVSFKITFNPAANAPRVVTKISVSSKMSDETEDTADPAQLKMLDGAECEK